MMSDLKELFGQVTTPGDAATVLLAGSAGFVVDAALNLVGVLSPGMVGVTAASSALGLKKAWEANRGFRIGNSVADPRGRAMALGEHLRDEDDYLLSGEVLRELQLNERGIVSDADLNANVDRILATYRAKTVSGKTTNLAAGRKEPLIPMVRAPVEGVGQRDV